MGLRVALIGGAGHVGYVTEGLKALPEASLCAVAPGCPEEDISLLQCLGAAPGVTVYTDYRDLLARERPDIVAVSPFYHLHAEATVAALQAGAAVYCEKPLALTLESLARVRAAVASSGRPLGIMLNYRYLPAFLTARRLVAAGAIGTPTVGYAQKSYKRGRRPDFYRQRSTFGGIIPWVGIHAIDFTRWISGCEMVSVDARHVKLHYPEYPGMEDAATCQYALDNGGSVVLSFDFLRPAGAPSHGDDRLRLVGDRGALEIRGDRLELIDAEGAREVAPESPTLGPFADFAESVRDPRHACAISAAEALRATEIALRSRDAADSGQRQALV
ncbi:MAG: Gfo/Idh/MocA family oxidoreductase [Lentisphaerae bacterium]|nr:Gfo/Idh/MocA family oxidoreductase [Lentisphaerota bacterium]